MNSAPHQSRIGTDRRGHRSVRRARNSMPDGGHTPRDHDSADRDRRRAVANPFKRQSQQRHRVHHRQYIGGDCAFGRARLLAWRRAARAAASAAGIRAAVVGVLRRAGIHLLPGVDRRLRRRAIRPDRHGGDVRHRGDDREYHDRARPGAAGHRQDGDRHAD